MPGGPDPGTEAPHVAGGWVLNTGRAIGLSRQIYRHVPMTSVLSGTTAQAAWDSPLTSAVPKVSGLC